jgi:hypothetical protein
MPDPDPDSSEALRTSPLGGKKRCITMCQSMFERISRSEMGSLAQHGRSFSYISNGVATHTADGSYTAALTPPPDLPTHGTGLIEPDIGDCASNNVHTVSRQGYESMTDHAITWSFYLPVGADP